MGGKTKKNDAGFVCAFWTARPEATVAKFAAHEVKTVGQLADIGPKGPWPCHEIEFGEFARKVFIQGNVTVSKRQALAWKNKAIEALKQK